MTEKMSCNPEARQKYAKRGRVLRGAMKSLGIRVVDIADEIGVSQGHLSNLLDTYDDLDITKAQEYIAKVEAVLAKRGIRISASDDQIVAVYDLASWAIDFD